MPLIYADSSTLIAYFHPRDIFSGMVSAAVERDSPDFIYWPFLRFEVRHNLRQLNVDRYGALAWKALRAAEKTVARLRWQPDLTADKILDTAEDLSAEKAASMECGSIDVIHIAAARKINLLSGIDEFWTCDAAQATLARAIGLKVRLFELKR
ncbi:MAG TPA: hypothetical protein VME24_05120 [Alphaproteobacteria bacterium]|nr:hypothetical protein [Alphaproteobacteria bacterium]